MSGEEQIIEVDVLPEEVENNATYLIKQSNPNSYTHGMFKYPCKFIPEIPRWGINKFLPDKTGVVFDPFAGSGTTLLEANIHGLDAYCTEIDDVAKLIIKVKTTVLTPQQQSMLEVEYAGIINTVFDDNAPVFRPQIENLEHWFSAETITQLGRMKIYIDGIDDTDVKDFFSLCMVSIIKKVSYADDTSPKPYVSNKFTKTPPPVEKEFTSVYKRYAQMMRELSELEETGRTSVAEGDALSFELPEQIDLAVTSPPYINAFDYGRTMRLENLWMDTLTEEELREKKEQYVGTEKIDTKQEHENLDILEKSDLLNEYFYKILISDPKRALIVKKFFEDMETNLKSVWNSLRLNGKYIIVIGNSTIRGINVESFKVIEELAENIGYTSIKQFSYLIQNPYIRIPRSGNGGKISKDYVLVLEKRRNTMAQKNRSKKLWLIPKRSNLHQTICLIDGIIERKYDGTSWNEQKQNNLGVNLKKWGATQKGKNISNQSIRTLTASAPQYLGFLYIDTAKRPNTIRLTGAGRELWNSHKKALVKVPNLAEGKDLLITKSDMVLRQMEKLQITNPIISKDCEGICLFPFRFMLKVLMETEYLDQEEIAFILLRARTEKDAAKVVFNVKRFRALPQDKREQLIDAFKKTHHGNITLVQAPSAGYFMSICEMTGIIDKIKAKPVNRKDKITALKINKDCISYVKTMLDKYKNVETYNFGNDLQLWIDYIGNPARDFPPIDVTLSNTLGSRFLIQVFKDRKLKYDDLLEKHSSLTVPMFPDEKYDVTIIDTDTGNEIKTISICPSFKNRVFELENIEAEEIKAETIEDIARDITEHCNAENFAGKTLNYLNALKKINGIDKTKDKSLRGAYLELFFFKLLTKLKEKGVTDDVKWNGKIGKYGLPISAPGGKNGTSDIIFEIGDLHVVLELTTIKSKDMQFKAEGSSVPDHIRLYRDDSGKKVAGVFSAPQIHMRNTNSMQATIAPYGIDLHCMTIEELLEVLLSKDRDVIKNTFSAKPKTPEAD